MYQVPLITESEKRYRPIHKSVDKARRQKKRALNKTSVRGLGGNKSPQQLREGSEKVASNTLRNAAMTATATSHKFPVVSGA